MDLLSCFSSYFASLVLSGSHCNQNLPFRWGKCCKVGLEFAIKRKQHILVALLDLFFSNRPSFSHRHVQFQAESLNIVRKSLAICSDQGNFSITYLDSNHAEPLLEEFLNNILLQL